MAASKTHFILLAVLSAVGIGSLLFYERGQEARVRSAVLAQFPDVSIGVTKAGWRSLARCLIRSATGPSCSGSILMAHGFSQWLAMYCLGSKTDGSSLALHWISV